MTSHPSTFANHTSRLGFHYFPDTLHYQQSDLHTWLPALKSLNASWLVLRSETRRAIPEFFISELVCAGIEPVIDFDLCLDHTPQSADLVPLFSAYHKWGVRGVLLSQRPNTHTAWQTPHHDLVELFLSHFLPLAELALENGLNPFFPALEPGGNYWDTIFLRTCLEALVQQKNQSLLQQLVLTAFAWSNHHPLNWGAGGPRQWPHARPYHLPAGQEDHRGFRIFDWYQDICQDVLGHACPIFLLQAGVPADPRQDPQPFNPDQHTDVNLSIARLLMNEKITAPEDPKTLLRTMDENILACNFWLLAADPASPAATHAWFMPDGTRKPVVACMQEHFGNCGCVRQNTASPQPVPSNAKPCPSVSHYLLLPPMDSEKVNAFLNDAAPFIDQYHPLIGFSVKEAACASHVSLVGVPDLYPQQILADLASAGCQIHHLAQGGTVFATR
jgi:hypothetical protein